MATNVAEKENRRIQRIALSLPSRIEVKISSQVSWNEITRLVDISAFGAGFSLMRPVKRGRLVWMTVPMPRQLRCFDYSDTQYKIWALVRRCIPVRTVAGEKKYMVGVAFVGKDAPSSYFEDPATLYDITRRDTDGLWRVAEAPSDPDEKGLPADVRRQTRFFIPEALTLEVIDEAGDVLEIEKTVTENISLGGAAVFTSLEIEAGSFLRVSSERYSLQIISVVRGKRTGPDGMTRLHLEFIDHFFPLDGIE